jgi:hypothetical protein
MGASLQREVARTPRESCSRTPHAREARRLQRPACPPNPLPPWAGRRPPDLHRPPRRRASETSAAEGAAPVIARVVLDSQTLRQP